ncbi:MAG TPA: glycogen synthase [Cytophagales bacterium]|jgi:glycogen synthase|nr:glycogen synthase [Cytophagales bacterium]
MSKKHKTYSDTIVVETAWEVCNQVGGIYTVIRSKAPSMVKLFDENFCMVGPYVNKNIHAEIEIVEDADDVFAQVVKNLRKKGYDVIYAEWLITGRPRVVLLNPIIEEQALNVVKYLLWKNHSIKVPDGNPLIDQIIAFAFLTKLFFDELTKLTHVKIIAHFHEWMAGLPILDIKREKMPIKTVFTTHATQLGRHLAINSPLFYAHLPFFKMEDEIKKFGIVTEASIEYGCAQQCNVLTTVSDVTANECQHLLKRKPEVITPNGLNIQRFEALHEFQNLHAQYKEKIQEFVLGHFFQSYSFDLDNTLYFFTSGRYEYKNKGFDLTLEALVHLNEQLKQEKSPMTVIMFFVTKREFQGIKSEVLQSRAVMEEIRQVCEMIQKQVGKKLFIDSVARQEHKLPELNNYVDEYWSLRYRRTLQSWKNGRLPSVVTHRLLHEENDDIVKFVSRRNLLNRPDDKVKIIYHPDFINSTNPLFGLDYSQFVRGCHLGIFPSYYEPWGYTPLECMASGVPAVTSDLSGFGDYLMKNMPDHEKGGMFVVERSKRTFDWSARQLSAFLYKFLTQTRRQRITQRNNVENYSSSFDWGKLIQHYEEAYEIALK